MKKELIYGIGGLLIGMILMGLLAYRSAPSMLMKEKVSKYDFETSLAVFEEAIKDMDWTTPAVHNMKQTMANFGMDVRNVKVYEICHPGHAYEILKLDDERIVSSMMPCRVSIYEKSDGKTYVSWMNTAMMGNMMGGVIADVMGVASRESEAMIRSVTE